MVAVGREGCPELCAPGFPQDEQAAFRHDHMYPSLPQPERGGISFSAREEPVGKKVSCLLVW